MTGCLIEEGTVLPWTPPRGTKVHPSPAAPERKGRRPRQILWPKIDVHIDKLEGRLIKSGDHHFLFCCVLGSPLACIETAETSV